MMILILCVNVVFPFDSIYYEAGFTASIQPCTIRGHICHVSGGLKLCNVIRDSGVHYIGAEYSIVEYSIVEYSHSGFGSSD